MPINWETVAGVANRKTVFVYSTGFFSWSGKGRRKRKIELTEISVGERYSSKG